MKFLVSTHLFLDTDTSLSAESSTETATQYFPSTPVFISYSAGEFIGYSQTSADYLQLDLGTLYSARPLALQWAVLELASHALLPATYPSSALRILVLFRRILALLLTIPSLTSYTW